MYTQRIHLLVSVINQPVLSSSDTAGQCGSVMLSLQITEGGGVGGVGGGFTGLSHPVVLAPG